MGKSGAMLMNNFKGSPGTESQFLYAIIVPLCHNVTMSTFDRVMVCWFHVEFQRCVAYT